MMDNYDISDGESQKDFASYLEDWRAYIADYEDDVYV